MRNNDKEQELRKYLSASYHITFEEVNFNNIYTLLKVTYLCFRLNVETTSENSHFYSTMIPFYPQRKVLNKNGSYTSIHVLTASNI